MSATKQYVRTRTAQGPPQPSAVPIVLQTPGASPTAIPFLFQQTNDAALQVAYNNSMPAQHFALSPTLLQQQSPTSDAHGVSSPPGPSGREPGAASVQPQTYTAYAPVGHPPHLSTSPNTTGDGVNYGMVQYVAIPTGNSAVGSVPVRSLLSSQIQGGSSVRQSPPGAAPSHVDSFPGFEYRHGYHGRERKTPRHKGAAFDPFEDSDTDASPIHAMRPRGYSHASGGSRAMDYSKSVPNAGMEMHHGHSHNRTGRHGRTTHKTIETDDEDEDQAHGSSPRSVLSSLFRRSKPRTHRGDNNTLTVPGQTSPRSRQHRHSVGAYDAPSGGFDRSRAMSSSHHTRPSHDEIYSRSSGPQQIPHRPGVRRAKSDSRYRRRDSMSETESDSDTETADERSHRRMRSRSRHGSHRQSHGDGHGSFHREALIGSLVTATENERRKAEKRDFAAGRRAGEEEARRYAEMKERCAKRNRGAGAMGGGA